MAESDLDEVIRIEMASFPTPWPRESFVFEMTENPYASNLVLKEGGRVRGFACVWFVEDEMKINNIAVAPESRGKGLGSLLLDRILDEARSRGCREAALEVRPSNRVARRLYARRGFEETGRRRGYYQDTGEDAILMTLVLPQGGGG